jgi:hypothetical protein
MMLKETSVILAGDLDTSATRSAGVASPILANAMMRLKEAESKTMANMPKTPESFKNMDEALTWLKGNLKTDKTTSENLTNKYQALVLEELKKHADTIRSGLKKSGIDLKLRSPFEIFNGNFPWLKLLGILVSAGFLSLGPAFLFNALKMLCNLRPLTGKTTALPTT